VKILFADFSLILLEICRIMVLVRLSILYLVCANSHMARVFDEKVS
jgi:hypothetical protein